MSSSFLDERSSRLSIQHISSRTFVRLRHSTFILCILFVNNETFLKINQLCRHSLSLLSDLVGGAAEVVQLGNWPHWHNPEVGDPTHSLADRSKSWERFSKRAWPKHRLLLAQRSLSLSAVLRVSLLKRLFNLLHLDLRTMKDERSNSSHRFSNTTSYLHFLTDFCYD